MPIESITCRSTNRLFTCLRANRNHTDFYVLVLLIVAMTSPGANAHTPHDDITDMAISPSFDSDKSIFVIARGNLLKSTDAGKSWQRLVNGLDHQYALTAIAISAADPNTVVVSSYGDGIFRSKDGGDTWFRAGSDLVGLALVKLDMPDNLPHLVLAIDIDGKLFRSVDDGGSWERVVLPSEKITTIARTSSSGSLLIGDESGNIFQSTDLGVSWTKLAAIGQRTGITSISATGEEDASRIIFAGTVSGNVVKIEGADSSLANVDIGISGEPITSIAMSPNFSLDGVVMVSTWKSGVACSRDGGSSWSACHAGLTWHKQADALNRPYFGEIHLSGNFSADRTVFLEAFNGLFTSDNSAEQWHEIETISGSTIVGIGASPDHAADSTLAVTTYLWGAYLSKDKGKNWRSISDGVDDYDRREGLSRLFNVIFSPGFATDSTLYSSTWYRLLKSTNRGDAWSQVRPEGVTDWNDTHHGIVIVPSPEFEHNGLIMAVTHRGQLLRSEDAGNSFSTAGVVGHIVSSMVISPDFGTDHTLYVGGPDGVFFSSDAGLGWTTASSGLPIGDEILDPFSSDARERAIKLHISPGFNQDGVLFASTNSGIFKTEDRGLSWAQLGGKAYGGRGFVEGLAISPEYRADQTLLASIRGKGLFRSTDGGRTFLEVGKSLRERNIILANSYGFPMPVSNPIVFSPTYATDRTVYGFSGDIVASSMDGGVQWSASAIPQPGLLKEAYVFWRYASNSLRRWKRAALLGVFAIFGASALILWRRLRTRTHVAS